MRILFEPHSQGLNGNEWTAREPFLNIGIVGAGDVVKNRIAPALKAMTEDGFGALRIAICSLEPTSPINSLAHKYYQSLPGNLLPLDDLYTDGFLNDRALWIVATPPQTHVQIALQLRGMCGRVAIEKPLATSARYARVLHPSVVSRGPLFPLDHKLFTAECLSFLDECRENPAWLSRVDHVEGVFYESSAFPPERAQEDGIFDIQWHMFMLLIAALKHLGQRFEIEVKSVRIARHGSDPSGTFSDAVVCTASCMKGTVILADLGISFEFRQAKAATGNEKHARFFDARGSVLAHVDLSESGWQAHGRMLRALVGATVDTRHTLADAIALTELLYGASATAQEAPVYAFGSLPLFMQAQCHLGAAPFLGNLRVVAGE
jgi:hypothetical protein